MTCPVSYRAGLEAAAQMADKWHDQNKAASAAQSRKAARLGNDPFGHGDMARQAAADLAFAADECRAVAAAIRALPVPAADDEAMVERVARALAREISGNDKDDEDQRWPDWVDEARAALAAMREGKP